MEIYCKKTNRIFEVRKMTVEEKMMYFKRLYLDIHVSRSLTSDEKEFQFSELAKKTNNHCYVELSEEKILHVFSEVDKCKRWFPVSEQLSLF